MTNLRKLYKYLLDILFPLVCIDCRAHIENDANGPICGYCFQGIAIGRSHRLLFAIGNYNDETLRKLIHALKYERVRTVEKVLSGLIKKYLENLIPKALGDEANSIFVPIPLHAKKARQRGFNQAEIIANLLNEHTKIPVRTDIIKRVKNTKPQIHLSDYKEREKNVENSFALVNTGEETFKNKNIIIVDDVYTSGATITEATRVLRKLKPKSIKALVIARA